MIPGVPSFVDKRVVAVNLHASRKPRSHFPPPRGIMNPYSVQETPSTSDKGKQGTVVEREEVLLQKESHTATVSSIFSVGQGEWGSRGPDPRPRSYRRLVELGPSNARAHLYSVLHTPYTQSTSTGCDRSPLKQVSASIQDGIRPVTVREGPYRILPGG